MTDAIVRDMAGRSGPAGGPVLSVRDLRVSFPSEAGRVDAVRGVSFELMPGSAASRYQSTNWERTIGASYPLCALICLRL